MQTTMQCNIACPEAQMLAAARAGNATDLVTFVYERLLPRHATKLVGLFCARSAGRLEVEDVRQAGVVMVLRRLEAALGAQNPIGFLVHAARMAMLNYCKEQQSLIRVPVRSQYAGKRVPTVLSLDAPLGDGEAEWSLGDLLAAEEMEMDAWVLLRERLGKNADWLLAS